MLHVLGNKGAQPSLLVYPILAYCRASDADGGPIIGQYWMLYYSMSLLLIKISKIILITRNRARNHEI